MRIFLTGASGLLGSNFAEAAARRRHEVIGTMGGWDGPPIPGMARQLRLDLRDLPAVASAVLAAFPDAIVNCAAISEMARCEADPAAAHRLNVGLPQRLAELAHHLGARCVHVSSEQVFDGNHAPYRATDPVAPLSVYARQKVESEQAVAAAAPATAVTVRAPLLLGRSPGGRRSVHERMFLDWMAGRVLRLNTDEIRQPGSADNLAEVLVELCERPNLRGVFQWGGTEAVSRHALGRAIAEHFNIAVAGRLEPVQLAGTAAAATRPLNLTLDLRPLAGLLRTRPEPLAVQLARLTVPPAALAWWQAL